MDGPGHVRPARWGVARFAGYSVVEQNKVVTVSEAKMSIRRPFSSEDAKPSGIHEVGGCALKLSPATASRSPVSTPRGSAAARTVVLTRWVDRQFEAAIMSS